MLREYSRIEAVLKDLREEEESLKYKSRKPKFGKSSRRVIYVECKPDSILVKSLIKISKKEIIHAGNKSEICKKLEKQENCIGLVDEDPNSPQPTYMKRMEAEFLSEHGLKILHDKRYNRLVVLCPRLEEWLLEAVKQANVQMGSYGLPNEGMALHERININLNKLERLIHDLKDCDRIKNLKKISPNIGNITLIVPNTLYD
ncbi:MAG: hypothetical protein KIH10_07140 [Candidatus Freyarchaeota archaeon]|nr:hypothetical protein [Candidatus Jordarchaeia archaeon]MBS7279809.1 hypothetical protein [Candidatus Jordarchaeia archaeon]